MLPGVELARRRRVHYHGDATPPLSGEHHHAQAHHAGAAAVAGPALAARIRLEEKLRGAALPLPLPPTSPSSRWSRLMRDGGRAAASTSTSASTSTRRQQHQSRRDHQEQQAQLAQRWLLVPPPGNPAAASLDSSSAVPVPALSSTRRRAELTRTLSKVEVCAVCLEEVRARERVTRLPCSHKYHSECVLPWLAIHPDCPCCRALVPSAVHALL